MSRPAPHARYLEDSVSTASPAQLVVLLYDRLVLDLDRAVEALDGGRTAGAHPHLLHAQEILAELLTGLDTAAWAGGPGLAALYGYLINELVAANLASDPARVRACRELAAPLRDAWREAAALLTGEPGTPAGEAATAAAGGQPAGPAPAGAVRAA